jgi:ABC-type branched-subunit amino acid transport system permease subunit
LTAFIVGGQGTIALPPVLWGAIPADHQPACMAAWAAHATSYGMALFGGLFVIGVVWYRRGVAGRAN